MVAYTQIQSFANRGNALAAKYVGQSYNQYRPTSTTNPIIPANLVGTLMVRAKPTTTTTPEPNVYGNAVWKKCIYDRTSVQVGDYLVGPLGTFFVGAEQPLLPNVLVNCNRTIDIIRESSNGGANIAYNPNFYSGDGNRANDTLFKQWPASLITGHNNDMGLLSFDEKQAGCTVLLPNNVGMALWDDDIIIDDTGRRMEITSVEITDMGYRISTSYVGV